MYYLTRTAKQRNAKRHIILKSKDLDYLRKISSNINKSYVVEIYTGKWELVERF